LPISSGAAVNPRMGKGSHGGHGGHGGFFVNWSVALRGHPTSSAESPDLSKTAFCLRIGASSRESTRQSTKPSVPSVSSVRAFPHSWVDSSTRANWQPCPPFSSVRRFVPTGQARFSPRVLQVLRGERMQHQKLPPVMMGGAGDRRSQREIHVLRRVFRNCGMSSAYNRIAQFPVPRTEEPA
jgi:hypothetical protein